MKLIDYAKYNGSPRSMVMVAVLGAVLTGFFLGAAMIVVIRERQAGT